LTTESLNFEKKKDRIAKNRRNQECKGEIDVKEEEKKGK